MEKLILSFAFAIFVFSSAQAQFAGGAGTKDDPFLVETIEQLQTIADTSNLNKHFLQIFDIDATETENWNGGNVSNISISGNVKDYIYVGGLLGYNLGNVEESQSDGIVECHAIVGSLVGYNKAVLLFSTVGSNYKIYKN